MTTLIAVVVLLVTRPEKNGGGRPQTTAECQTQFIDTPNAINDKNAKDRRFICGATVSYSYEWARPGDAQSIDRGFLADYRSNGYGPQNNTLPQPEDPDAYSIAVAKRVCILSHDGRSPGDASMATGITYGGTDAVSALVESSAGSAL